MSTETLLAAALALSAGSFVLLAVLLLRDLRRTTGPSGDLLRLQAEIGQLAQGLREGFSSSRQESGRGAAELRGEITRALATLGDSTANRLTDLFLAQAGKLGDTTTQIAVLTDGNERRQEALKAAVETRLGEIRVETAASALQLRDEIAKTLKGTSETLVATLTQMSEAQRERLNVVSRSVADLTQAHKGEQEILRHSVEARLDQLRTENGEKLEQMRVTVDEKLQGTLEQRLGASFKLVSEQLEQVYKSVGEMQSLATGVGDLKRVLSNVKARGTWGEVTLGDLLDQVLTHEQFGRNVEVVPGTGQRIEYAIRLPGEGDSPLWLPIDCKFPAEDYDRLTQASERGDVAGVDEAAKAIEAAIKLCARTIATKYVAPPHTTDFGVLFLPTEGLFAEVIRRPGLVETLQRDYRITVAGPTTLAAMLTSFRMGFRTLAIQKSSGEVWKVLGAVKTEFGKYGDVLDKVKKKLEAATQEIETVAVRRRAVDRALRNVEGAREDSVGLLAFDSGDELFGKRADLIDDAAA